jgi:hypothetical protein
MIMVFSRIRFVLLVIVLALPLSACNLPGMSFSAPVWVTNVPVSFSGSVHVVEYHFTSAANFSCAVDAQGVVAVDKEGNAALTTQGGTLAANADGQCAGLGKEKGWQVEGQVEQPSLSYLKFTTCSNGQLRAEGSAEYVVMQYETDTQISKLTGGITCFDKNNKPISTFSFYLTTKEPRTS